MTGRLQGKVALVTGAGGSIGRAVCRRFAADGARLAATDINGAALRQGLATITTPQAEVLAIENADLTAEADIDRIVDETLKRFGRVDILVNNGAMAYFGWMEDIAFDTFRRTVTEELEVVFRLTRALWNQLIAQGGGAIVNLGSVSGKRAYEVLPGVAHMAAKGGVIAMTKQMAMEGGRHNIRVNSVSPGLIRTNQTDEFLKIDAWRGKMMDKLMLKRVGEPEDVANAIGFLASDEAAWITGADLSVDGGTTAW